jgi:hypothetical protein
VAGEAFGPAQLIGLALVFLGVVMGVRAGRRRTTGAPACASTAHGTDGADAGMIRTRNGLYLQQSTQSILEEP